MKNNENENTKESLNDSKSQNPEKRGGPYTKKEQEDRRNEVYKLYFEKGHSAVKIAEMLEVQRNTINNDIKFWHSQIGLQMGSANAGALFVRQVERLEILRKRLLDLLDTETTFENKLALEKILFDLEQKLASIATKIIDKKIILDSYDLTDEIGGDEEIRNIIRQLISKDPIETESISCTHNKIVQHTIQNSKCTESHAEDVVDKMMSLGLNTCYQGTSVGDGTPYYNLLKFAKLRGYITKEELAKRKEGKRKKDVEDNAAEKKCDQILEQLEKDFIKKYGDNKFLWSEDVREKYDKHKDAYESELEDIFEGRSCFDDRLSFSPHKV